MSLQGPVLLVLTITIRLGSLYLGKKSNYWQKREQKYGLVPAKDEENAEEDDDI